ncbi:DUF2442 domain-containing protein [Edwardsiella ictaluri]|uniref:DUF2442 domain-containing protein n=1 Tax=Edwardsiella ictaluri TaxID=67780 RepID=A0ABY8GHT3_EDWIC|nr:DUF2442 domain-containing protein [Edwardsiella ictaluri]ARD39180.1 integron cassette protein [Edwardsiella ictaluri]ELV7528446.1 DUF2442 domain-containing protein [Edwardsiella ictaluri]KMQ79159.1 integron cassette protein [Edwardsiella ictaluri]KOO55764.1 integron cassette protein [Edwardsiella ictaluri]QPW27610.1 DUF2442 domain-containing protein [Edwardsiella ictaluri]
MKSEQLGVNISVAEVLGLTSHGIWLLAQGEVHFLPYEHFPWFKSATIDAAFNVEQMGRDGLYWPDLDIDLSIDSIHHPENYPLVSHSQRRRQ